MVDKKEFTIQFSGLATGVHQFGFEIDQSFFETFDYGDLADGNLTIDCMMEKQERMLIFTFDIKGKVGVVCDRCLDDFDLPVEGKERLIVKFGNEAMEENDEIVVIPEQEHEIDLSQYLYEYINLMLPYRKVHGEDENGESLCNQEVIKRIEEHTQEEETDPRWDALKKLKNK